MGNVERTAAAADQLWLDAHDDYSCHRQCRNCTCMHAVVPACMLLHLSVAAHDLMQAVR